MNNYENKVKKIQNNLVVKKQIQNIFVFLI